jgi:hypothetical protein
MQQQSRQAEKGMLASGPVKIEEAFECWAQNIELFIAG